MSDTFSLERTENPHPRMLTEALKRRDAARRTRGWPGMASASTRAEWAGYLAAMCDATGESPEAIEAWMDRHEV
jgi:hypothetical protein